MNDKDDLFRRYLDGDLSAEEEQEALHLFADDEDLRSMLRFEMKLQNSFRIDADLSSFEVPAGFSDKVMTQIGNTATNEEKVEESEKGINWLDWLWRPRPVEWRPAYTMILILVIAVILVLPNYSGQQQSTIDQATIGESVQTVSETPQEVWTRFIYIDEDAQSIAVAGDFSDWEPVSLSKEEINGKTVWTGLVSMNRGEHRYMFVKDGEQWVTDPLAPMHREDGFGNKNAVIYL